MEMCVRAFTHIICFTREPEEINYSRTNNPVTARNWSVLKVPCLKNVFSQLLTHANLESPWKGLNPSLIFSVGIRFRNYCCNKNQITCWRSGSLWPLSQSWKMLWRVITAPASHWHIFFCSPSSQTWYNYSWVPDVSCCMGSPFPLLTAA